MKRLTKRNGDGYSLNHENCPKQGDCYDSADCVAVLVERLAAYEDAEEKGLLVRLPCKIGSTIYTLRENYFDCEHCVNKSHAYWNPHIYRTACDMEDRHCPLSIQEHVVGGFEVSQGEADGVEVSGPGEWGYEGLETFYGFDGKWYHTCEEAEARLAELHETEEKDNAE